MAEHGAHLTSTEQSLPSIFEVVASDSLGSTFYLAVKRLCNVNRYRPIEHLLLKLQLTGSRFFESCKVWMDYNTL